MNKKLAAAAAVSLAFLVLTSCGPKKENKKNEALEKYTDANTAYSAAQTAEVVTTEKRYEDGEYSSVVSQNLKFRYEGEKYEMLAHVTAADTLGNELDQSIYMNVIDNIYLARVEKDGEWTQMTQEEIDEFPLNETVIDLDISDETVTFAEIKTSGKKEILTFTFDLVKVADYFRKYGYIGADAQLVSYTLSVTIEEGQFAGYEDSLEYKELVSGKTYLRRRDTVKTAVSVNGEIEIEQP